MSANVIFKISSFTTLQNTITKRIDELDKANFVKVNNEQSFSQAASCFFQTEK